MKLKKTLLAFPLQFPFWFASVIGVQFLTDLNIWWSSTIVFVLMVMYDCGEWIRRSE